MKIVARAWLLFSSLGRLSGDVWAFAPHRARTMARLGYPLPSGPMIGRQVAPLCETKIEDEYENDVMDLQRDVDIAIDEAAKSEQRIGELQSMVEEAQANLASATQEMKEGKDNWAKEKVSFVRQINELTEMLNLAGGERKNKDAEATAVARKRQKDLEQDVKNYSIALEQAQEALQMEKSVADELKERLLNAEDRLEFEQMRFKKEKDDLTQLIDVEKAKLVDFSNRFEDQKKQFQIEKSDFERKIERETSRVEEAETKLERVRTEFENTQGILRKEIESQSKKLKDLDARLTSEKTLRTEERAELELHLAQETEKLQLVERQLSNDRELFKRIKADLEDRIQVEKKRVGVLSQQLEVEQQRYIDTKERLETTIAEEKTRLTEVQSQLEQEQLQFQKEKSMLEDKVDDGIRVRKLKAKQMNERYEKIRSEMSSLYEGAKRDARKQRTLLTEKYSKQIDKLNGTIERLECDLAESRDTSESMKAQIESYERAKQQFVVERGKMEKSFTAEIGKKNEVIVSLEQSVADLTSNVRQKDATIEQYRSSFREIIGLGRELSRKRLRNARSRLRDRFRRRRV